MARLHKQKKSRTLRKQIGLYLGCWLTWGILGTLSTVSADSTVSGSSNDCHVRLGQFLLGSTTDEWIISWPQQWVKRPTFIGTDQMAYALSNDRPYTKRYHCDSGVRYGGFQKVECSSAGTFVSRQPTRFFFQTYSTTGHNSCLGPYDTLLTDEPSVSTSPVYLSVGASTEGSCYYTYDLDVSDGVYTRSNFIVVDHPTAPSNLCATNPHPIVAVPHAGADQDNVPEGTIVTLDGSVSSTLDAGDTLIYKWTQTNGAPVTLSDNDSSTADKPTFTAPTLNMDDADVTLTFSLVVNDGTVDSAGDTVLITVKAPTVSDADSINITTGNGTLPNGTTTPILCGEAKVNAESSTTSACSGQISTTDPRSFEMTSAYFKETETPVSNGTLFERIRQFSWWNILGVSNALAVGAGDFSINLATFPYTVTNSSPVNFMITFTPTMAGQRDGILVIVFDDGSEFEFAVSGMGTAATLTNSSSNPQNIPVFGPLGLLVVLFGLLWFGNRRRKD